MRPHKQTIVLACLGLFDLVSTLWLLRQHGGAEANPLMARFLAWGVGMFIVAKLGFLVGPLVVLEWARKRAPRFVNRAGGVAVTAYLGFYLCGVVYANVRPFVLNDPNADDTERHMIWTRIERAIAEKRRQAAGPARGETPRAEPESGDAYLERADLSEPAPILLPSKI